jgi:outer membrane receptor protein involved in Fe transport
VLPSFNLRAEFSRSLVGRLSASRVLTRPNVTDSAPRITVSTDAPTASGGNPALVPFLATQFDGSLEWYFNPTGSLNGAVFYKALDNYITQQNVPIDIPGAAPFSSAPRSMAAMPRSMAWKRPITRSSRSCPSRSMASASRPRTRARLWRRATPPVRARSPTN